MAFVNHKPNHHPRSRNHHHVSSRNHRGSHLRTNYIAIQSQHCTSCGTCIKECPRGVIGQIHFLGHKHAHINSADDCIGCKKCVKTCPNKAIIELPNNDRLQRTEAAEIGNKTDTDWASTVLDLLR